MRNAFFPLRSQINNGRNRLSHMLAHMHTDGAIMWRVAFSLAAGVWMLAYSLIML